MLYVYVYKYILQSILRSSVIIKYYNSSFVLFLSLSLFHRGVKQIQLKQKGPTFIYKIRLKLRL